MEDLKAGNSTRSMPSAAKACATSVLPVTTPYIVPNTAKLPRCRLGDNDHHVNKSGVIRPSGSSVDANGNTLYIASCALPPAGLALEEMEKRAEWRIIKPSQRK